MNLQEKYKQWQISRQGNEELYFCPMLPTLYDVLLPTLESRLNFINVGQRHVSFIKYIYGDVCCDHTATIQAKIENFGHIVTKLLDINSILETQE